MTTQRERIERETDKRMKLEKENSQLKIENKNLKRELELVRKNTRANVETLDIMNAENEELKEENAILKKYYDRDKEELSESCYGLARENDKLKLHIEAKDKAYMDLLTDYDYLKARIKRMEKAYLKFHDDLKNLDDELDNVIMNR